MHYFAVLLLFSFGAMAITMLGERVYKRFREARAFVAGACGVGLAWLANLNMWKGFGVGNLRYDWVGVTLTGLAVGGAALIVYALFGWFMGLDRKLEDQAEEIEKSQLRRVA